MGGSNECSRTLDTVEVLNLEDSNSQWSAGPTMLNKRVSHGAATLDGCIYVVGGWDGQGVVRSVEMLNPSKGEWVQISTYPEIR